MSSAATTSQKALVVETVPIDRVIPYARNPRKNAGAVAKVAASIREFGFRQPIVVDQDWTVIAGHTRLLAARQLGLTEVPVHRALGLTPAQVRAYRIADNRVAEDAEWDDSLLRLELTDLEALDFDLSLTGFEPAELARVRGSGLLEGVDPDDVPEPPVEPTSREGDVIVLGRHRLVCGDSQHSAAWEALLEGQEADMVWTDPPYGVGVASRIGTTSRSSAEARLEGGDGIANDTLDFDGLCALLRASLGLTWAFCRRGAAWYVAAPHGPVGLPFSIVLKELDVWRSSIVWVKDSLVLGRADYHYRHEPLYYGWKGGAAHYFVDDRSQDTVWEIPRPKRSLEHPTMKPVALVQRSIENSTKPGAVVVDPFGGSGTTLMASEASGRSARVIELDPKFCDVIVARWEKATGLKAERLAAVAV